MPYELMNIVTELNLASQLGAAVTEGSRMLPEWFLATVRYKLLLDE